MRNEYEYIGNFDTFFLKKYNPVQSRVRHKMKAIFTFALTLISKHWDSEENNSRNIYNMNTRLLAFII